MHHGEITENFLKIHMNEIAAKNVYICGPPPMMEVQ